jgi:hypothetical protein
MNAPITFDHFPVPLDWDDMVPDSDIPPDEGDDGTTILSERPLVSELSGPPWPLDASRKPKPTRPPFPGTLHPGHTPYHHPSAGREVAALQRALQAARCRFKPPTGTYGRTTEWSVSLFQKRHGLHADGVVGEKTWHKLNYPQDGHKGSYFDAYGYWLVAHRKKPVAAPAINVRDRIVRVAMWGYFHRYQMHYLQTRPMLGMNCPPGIDEYCDCSEFATLCYKCAGAPDPNWLHFDGSGNTDTMLAHGRSVALPAPGDLVLYANPGHVIVCTKWPMGVSNGSEGGPYYTDMRYRPIQAFRSYV